MNPIVAKLNASSSLLCIGLDSEFSKIPSRFYADPAPQFSFNKWIVEQTADFVSTYKLNAAFYEARGAAGYAEMAQTVAWIHENHPGIVTICDAKRADIGNTNRGYVEAIFDGMGADAITLHPFLGEEALAPFLEREDKLSIILCHTSNPGAGELQDLVCDGKPLWQHVALNVEQRWNKRGNCALVVGATWPEEMRAVRKLAPSLPILVPGIGAQGGDVAEVVQAGLDSNGRGLMISSSRAVIFADDPHAEAQKLFDSIETARAVTHAR